MAVGLVGSGFSSGVRAQTITGTLMEATSDRPISLGLVIMMTEAGDSITSAVTNANGLFQVESSVPGDFVLIASAFGFKETRVGVFELGQGGSMNIEFRIGARAMPIDGILVELQRPAIQHQLITNGYVRRLQRGLGHFITPFDIENGVARSSGDLFRGLPGVSVQSPGGGGLNSYLGEQVRFLDARGSCTPTFYVDGMRMADGLITSTGIDDLVPITTLDAVEVYRRPSEVPVEYAATGVGDGFGACGVVLMWTKTR